MTTEPAIVPVPSPPRRGASAIVVAGAILVALAILKPWALGPAAGAGDLALATVTPGAAGLPSAGSLAAAPTATAPAAIPDPNAMACMSSEGNRVLALTRGPGLEIRTWLTVDDVSLSNPLDPAVVPLRLPASNVLGLGICARRIDQAATLSSAATFLEVARIASQQSLTGTVTPVLLDLGPPRMITRQLDDPTLGVLYGPPPEGLAPGPVAPGVAAGAAASAVAPPSVAASPFAGATTLPTWSDGEYAIEFTFPADPPNTLRWIRLEIVPAVGEYG